jgi:hypothetical protein
LVLAHEKGAWAVKRGDSIIMRLTVDGPGELRSTPRDNVECSGWVSPEFGLKQLAPRLIWRGVIPDDGLTTTVQW